MSLFDKKNQEKEEEKKLESSGLNVLDVDLIKGEGEKVFNWSKYIAYIFLAFVATTVLCLEVYWLIAWWEEQENKRAQEIELNVKVIQAEVSQLEAEYKELTEFKTRADMMSDLLDKHPYWVDFFNWLERRTISTVTWDSFSGDLSGSYSLQAEASTFADISWQVRSFLDDDLVRSVSVDSGRGGLVEEEVEIEGVFDNEGNPVTETSLKSSVNFSLKLEIDPVIFYR